MKTTIKYLLGITFVTAIAVTTYAFTGPTNPPTNANSSAGSLLYLMAGTGFTTADSLEAIGDKLSSITSSGTDLTVLNDLTVNGDIRGSGGNVIVQL